MYLCYCQIQIIIKIQYTCGSDIEITVVLDFGVIYIFMIVLFDDTCVQVIVKL